MPEETALSGTAAETKAAKNRVKKEPEAKKVYVVKKKGYKETFPTYEKAFSTFEVLKKKSIKEKKPVLITLSEKTIGSDAETVLDEIEIKKDHYGEDD